MEISFLKPCPFCGEPAIVDPCLIEAGYTIDNQTWPDWWTCSIICSKCPCQIVGGGNSQSEATHDAMQLWNRRA